MDEWPEMKRPADFDYRGRPSASWLYCVDSAVLKQTFYKKDTTVWHPRTYRYHHQNYLLM